MATQSRAEPRSVAGSPVRAWEEPLTLPALRVRAPERSPLFYDGRQTQHAQARYYPYAALDGITEERHQVTYRALCLENEYLRVTILPELGGRIFSALDKTNGYEFFYRQSVIKPSNIGMIGAWISGGVEWCFPHHHRATTFMTVDHRMITNPDGSATVWVGEIEIRHRMKWLAGITLRPGSSALTVTIRLMNRTPAAHSVLYWANAAVHVNADYQFIFPPSARIASFHCKDAFTHWPISHEANFKGVDYRGIDLSWWKNHPAPGSFFIHGMAEDFHGGYDHRKRAGTLHVADHHVVNCAKLFTWGNCPEAEMENGKLTDADGHYAELMVGAFSDNQPDYSWMEPQQIREFTHWWYPLREIGLVKHATRDAAVNLDRLEGSETIRAAVNVTSRHADARIILSDASSGAVLLDRAAHLSPGDPFVAEARIPAAVQWPNLYLTVLSSGRPLITYRPAAQSPLPDLPQAMVPPRKPHAIASADELCHVGIRLEQFYNPVLSSSEYFDEALRRDPLHAETNTFLGIMQYKRFLFPEAERSLRTALATLEGLYTTPRKGEPYYYLGLVYAEQGRTGEAVETLHRATWYSEWYPTAHNALAGIAAREGDMQKALEHADKAIESCGSTVAARELRLMLLRNAARMPRHAVETEDLLRLDPLNAIAFAERYLADKSKQGRGELTALLHGSKESWLELASAYLDAGLWHDTVALVAAALEESPPDSSGMALFHYYRAYCLSRVGDARGAERERNAGSRCSVDYCFPHRRETLRVLRYSLQADPSDARAWYYLGTLLYDWQPGNAIEAWERSVALEPGLAMANRNLAFGLARSGNLPRAIEWQQKAVHREPANALWREELDVLLALAGESPVYRLSVLAEANAEVASAPGVLWKKTLAAMQAGELDTAISILDRTRFFNYEARRDKHQAFVSAHILRGDALVAQGLPRAARCEYERALEYPENLEAGKLYHDDLHAHVYSKLGYAAKAEGDGSRARHHFERSVSCRNAVPWSDQNYYQGLALRELGRENEALDQFRGLLGHCRMRFSDDRWYDFFAGYQDRESEASQKSTIHFWMGLSKLALGDGAGARAEWADALALYPLNLWARIELERAGKSESG